MQDAEKERQRRQRMRSIAIAWILAALAMLFCIVLIVRIGGDVAKRPLCASGSSMNETAQAGNDKRRRHGAVALTLVGLVAAMVGLSFAAVPLYRMFCQVTGYGGVPQRAEAAPAQAIDRDIKV